MKKYFFLIAFFTLAFQLFSQTGASINLALRNKIARNTDGNENMFLLVKGDVEKIRQFVIANEGTFINTAGDIVSVRLTLRAISRLIEMPFVIRVGSDTQRYITLNDTMRELAHVNEVHNGLSPLLHTYKGRGVLLGIIDSGLDLDHPDFKDSTGHTRVRWLWDMNLPNGANSPAPYNYGQEFSGQDIDNGLAAAHTGQDQNGHGTYVAGIAAGNGSAVGRFQGVAPESDLIIVGYKFNAADTVSRIAHAVEYIFSKAQQLGMPCVINASLGSYDGSHDGLDLEAQYIGYMISQQSGRVLVAACGDIGVNYPFHVGRNSVSGDTVFTWFNYTSSIGAAYINIYADTADFRDVRFSIGADKVTPYYSFRAQTNFTSVFPSVNNVVQQNLVKSGRRLGIIQTYTTNTDGVYHIEIIVIPDSTDYNWRFTTTGNGRYDSWTYDIYHPSWVWQNLPPDSVFPDITHYHLPDTFQTIVSGMNCLDNVISVGNYTNTDRHLDVDSVLQVTPADLPRQIATNSGRGPTRDGRIKPDIMAPGNHIISAGVAGLIASLPHNKIAPGGFHITGGGTSASAPVVAGIAALYLEQNPGANWLDVKNAIINCASQDSLMWGPYPNNAWGYGKVNAFEALTTCSLNVNIDSPEDATLSCSVYPNPVQEWLHVRLPDDMKSVAAIYDIEGRKLFETQNSVSDFSLPLGEISNGVYFLKIQSPEGKQAMKRFVVTREY